MKNWKKVFMKPTPSAESTNVKSFNRNNLKPSTKKMNNHVAYLKERKFEKVVAQKFMNNLGTQEHPELRTFWIGNKYQYTIETTGPGYDWNVRKSPLPKVLKQKCKFILRKLEEKFNAPLIITRLDWGYDKQGYFLNEIEYAPGTFAEMFKTNTWKIDKHMGDRIVQIAKNKIGK